MEHESSSSGLAGARREGARGWLAEISDALVSVFFPSGCRICDTLLTSASRVPLCEECLSSFKRVPNIVCEVCGRPLPGLARKEGEPLLCPACQNRTYAFDRARRFAERLAEVVNAEGDTLAADVVVPVPLHRERERERGYNQAALLSKPLARKLRLPHQAVLLVRTRARPDKQVLSLEERWESVRGAFATRPGSQVDNLRVLLVDDVLTTGATLDACARALREAGAKSVTGLTIARAVRNPLPSPGEW